MASKLQQLEEDYDNLNRMIRMGVTTITVGGQTTVFASMENMQKVANDLERQIAECKGVSISKPRISSIRMDRGV